MSACGRLYQIAIIKYRRSKESFCHFVGFAFGVLRLPTHHKNSMAEFVAEDTFDLIGPSVFHFWRNDDANVATVVEDAIRHVAFCWKLHSIALAQFHGERRIVVTAHGGVQGVEDSADTVQGFPSSCSLLRSAHGANAGRKIECYTRAPRRNSGHFPGCSMTPENGNTIFP